MELYKSQDPPLGKHDCVNDMHRHCGGIYQQQDNHKVPSCSLRNFQAEFEGSLEKALNLNGLSEIYLAYFLTIHNNECLIQCLLHFCLADKGFGK